LSRFACANHDIYGIKETEFTSDNIQHIWEMDAFPYPFTIKLNFTSPASRTYTVSKTISNRTDLENAFYMGISRFYDCNFLTKSINIIDKTVCKSYNCSK